jgi:hypothetical protein
MVLLLKDLAENPELLDAVWANQESCRKCGVALQETITGKRKTPAGAACSDCYYELLGEVIEQHPIASAGKRRG